MIEVLFTTVKFLVSRMGLSFQDAGVQQKNDWQSFLSPEPYILVVETSFYNMFLQTVISVLKEIGH